MTILQTEDTVQRIEEKISTAVSFNVNCDSFPPMSGKHFSHLVAYRTTVCRSVSGSLRAVDMQVENATEMYERLAVFCVKDTGQFKIFLL